MVVRTRQGATHSPARPGAHRVGNAVRGAEGVKRSRQRRRCLYPGPSLGSRGLDKGPICKQLHTHEAALTRTSAETLEGRRALTTEA